MSVDKLLKLIGDNPGKLKRLYTFKKEYEKLESNSAEFLNSLK